MNLDKLTHKDLVNLVKLCSEQERAYDDDKLALYVPHEIQDKFHRSDKKIRLFCGGNRIGKTTASVLEAIWIALGIHPYKKIPIPNKGKLYAVSFPTVMETFHPKFLEWIPHSALAMKRPFVYNQQGQLNGVNFANGSIIKIGSYDQETMKAEGSNWHYVGFDEPPSRDLYIANMRGLVDFGGYVWFSMTPLREPWIYDELWMPGVSGEKKYIECFSGSSDQNPHINMESLELFLDELTPEEREIRFEGKFARLMGLVIDTYSPEYSDIDSFEIDDHFVVYEGIDPHTSKPNCALWKAIHEDGFRFAIDELKFDGGIYDFGKAIVEKRKKIRKTGARLIRSISDTSLNVDDMMFKINQKDELCKSLTDAGETVMPEMANKKNWLFPGIAKLKDLFRVVNRTGYKGPTEYLFKDKVPNYKHDLLHYQWPDKIVAEKKPIKKFDDFIDPSRYIESIAPGFITPGQSALIKTYNGAYTRKDAIHG